MIDGPLRALLVELVRSGTIPSDDVFAAAEECSAVDDIEGASELTSLVTDALLPSATEAATEARRSSLHLVSDGGNTP